MKKKACRDCKLFVEGTACPICKGTDFSVNWQGRIIILNHGTSAIAQKMGIKRDGEYAIKLR
ncbi:MAG TPA: transcription elongation factor subunit Spt4 [Candidatus Nanoarchaeia archaeon]|nr:transcription elongation factor subunit Spt4 [Candidatus Nanoarchaeia archaeon]